MAVMVIVLAMAPFVARPVFQRGQAGRSPDVDPHTVSRLDDVGEFERFATTGPSGQQVVKFTISAFLGDEEVVFLDGDFYELHDEWYWYLLLNGVRAPGSDREPVAGNTFASIEEVYAWAASQQPEELPLDLRYSIDGRLYSSEFYDLGLGPVGGRTYGFGTIFVMCPQVVVSGGSCTTPGSRPAGSAWSEKGMTSSRQREVPT